MKNLNLMEWAIWIVVVGCGAWGFVWFIIADDAAYTAEQDAIRAMRQRQDTLFFSLFSSPTGTFAARNVTSVQHTDIGWQANLRDGSHVSLSDADADLLIQRMSALQQLYQDKDWVARMKREYPMEVEHADTSGDIGDGYAIGKIIGIW